MAPLWMVLVVVCGQQAPTTEAVRASMMAPPGMEVALVASDPLVRSPVAGVFDARGRLWVVEMPDYPTGPKPGEKPGGAIKILQDDDGDGVFDSASNFADGLLFANGLMLWKDGVIVTCAPEVLYLRDTDGDGKADRRTVLLEGLAQANPQLRPSFPLLTHDGWVQVSSGLRGGQVWKAGETAKNQISLAGMDFRFRPDGSAVEASTGPGQFGNTLDAWGNRFVCDNRHHLRHVVMETAVVQGNPLLAPGELLVDVAGEEGGPLSSGGKVYPISRNWTTSNLHAGRFTAASGMLAFQGAGLGKEHQGSVFTCDPTGNLVHEERLSPKGLTFSARSPQQEREFLAAKDEWFRPVSLVEAPDGSLLILDMARAVIEHPEFMPPELRNRPDLLWGRDQGRIWRVRASGVPRSPIRDLTQLGVQELVDCLGDVSGWVRGTAFRLLMEGKQGHRGLTELLMAKALKGPPLARFHAVWLLAACGLERKNLVGMALADGDDHVAEVGLALAKQGDLTGEQLVSMAGRGSERLAGKVAQAAQTLAAGERTGVLTKIALSHGEDAWIRLSVLASAQGCQRALLASLESPPAGKDVNASLLKELARQCGRSLPVQELGGILEGAYSTSGTEVLVGGLLLGLTQRGNAAVGDFLASLPPAAKQKLAAFAMKQMAVAQDQAVPLVKRLEALFIGGTVNGREEGMSGQLFRLLREDTEAQVRVRAAGLLAGCLAEDRQRDLVECWKAQLPVVRSEILDLAGGNFNLARAVLDGVEAGAVPVTDLDARRAARWMAFADLGLAGRAKKLLAACIAAPRDGVIAQYKGRALAGGDALRGREVFARNCASCHKVEGQGKDVGPDISDTRTKTEEMLLGDILDPNRAIDGAYVAQAVTTASGRLRVGVIKGASGGSITLLLADGTVENLARGDIEEIVSTGKSLMPEGLEKTISPEQMADLIRYLKDWRYLDGKTPRAGG